MFDKHMICTEGFRNVEEHGRKTGFALLARLPYYRGLGLSMIEDIALTVDGNVMPRECIRFSVRGRTWTLEQMETAYDDRWNFGEKATLVVLQPGGLRPGPHKIELAERLRISYLPFVPTTKDAKELVLEA